MSTPTPNKRDAFRARLQITLRCLAEREAVRERWDERDNPDFDEADYPTPLFWPNVQVQCAPVPLQDVEQLRKEGVSVDDMMVRLYDARGQPPASFELATFKPANESAD